ncbi:tol-pal system protein YbgF [Phenylobacterium sp.]|jgi:tol-pal system protein YbgF|uniref:tol-pal system protein YbgF n=1 Tax=Phenylobacterium sp. TaxID=1871053 RepID=UPI0035B1F6F9
MKLPVLALCLFATAAAAPLAAAQTPMDPLDARDARRIDKMEQVVRELRAIVFQGRDIGKPVVVQPAETDYQLQEVTRRLADLEQSMTRMTGDLESANRQAELAKRDAEQLRAENKSLADRLASLESRALAETVAPPDGLAGGPSSGLPAGDLFTQSRQALASGDYAAAENGFREYVDAHGETSKAPEARYWLGKALSARGAHADAAGSYIAAIRGWPSTSWAPDAVVELSRSLIALKKPADACQTLAELAKRYPKASTTVQTRAAQARSQAKCAA